MKKIVLLAFLITMACGGTQIEQTFNGIPISPYQYYVGVPDPSTELQVGFYAAGWYDKKINDEDTIPYPIYFPLNEETKLPKYTKFVVVHMWIRNPRAIGYNIKRRIESSSRDGVEVEFKSSYSGNRVNTQVNVLGPPVEPGKDIKMRIVVCDEKGIPLISIGDVLYRVD